MKKIVALLLCLCMLLPLAGCGKNKTDESKELVVLSTLSIPQDVLDGFEQETGIAVQVKKSDTNEYALQKFTEEPAAYDLVIAGDYIMNDLRAGNFLSPLQAEKLPDLKNVNKVYQNKYYDPQSSYTVPLNAGAILLAYDSEKISAPPQKWADLLKNTYPSKISFIENATVMVGICNLILQKDPDETGSLADVEFFLQSLSEKAVVQESANPQETLINKSAATGIMYNQQIGLAMEKNPDLKMVYPEEGFFVGADCIAISVETDAPSGAHAFVNYLLKAENNAKFIMENKGSSTLTNIDSYLDEKYKQNSGFYLSAEQMENGIYLTPLPESTDYKFYETYYYNFYELLNAQQPEEEN